MGIKYPEILKQEILSYTKKHGSALAAEKYKVHSRSIQYWLKAERGDGSGPEGNHPLESSHIEPLFSDLKITSLDWREALSAIKSTQSVVNNATPGQHEAHVHINTLDPIILVPSADWHLGGYATDYTQFQEDIEYVLSTPKLYVLDLGDGIDNFTNFKSVEANLNQVLPPRIQKQLLTNILLELARAGKLIARVWSNHIEEFDERIMGGVDEEFNKLVPYLKDDGRLFLTIGDIEYKIFAKHTFPGKSQYHRNHGGKKAVILEWSDADITISGHTHDGPEEDNWNFQGQHRISIKLPTYKVDDTYARRKFGRSGQGDKVGVQGIVLFPKEKKMVTFRDVKDAVRYLNG